MCRPVEHLGFFVTLLRTGLCVYELNKIIKVKLLHNVYITFLRLSVCRKCGTSRQYKNKQKSHDQCINYIYILFFFIPRTLSFTLFSVFY